MNPTHTHVGRKRNVAYANRGRLYGHSMPKAGKWHALVGPGFAKYSTLCGEVVYAETRDDEPAYSVASAANVYEASEQAVTCARCLAKIRKAANAAH